MHPLSLPLIPVVIVYPHPRDPKNITPTPYVTGPFVSSSSTLLLRNCRLTTRDRATSKATPRLVPSTASASTRTSLPEQSASICLQRALRSNALPLATMHPPSCSAPSMQLPFIFVLSVFSLMRVSTAPIRRITASRQENIKCVAVVSRVMPEMPPVAPLRNPVLLSPLKKGITVNEDDGGGVATAAFAAFPSSSYSRETSAMQASKSSSERRFRNDRAHSTTLPPSVSAPPRRTRDRSTR